MNDAMLRTGGLMALAIGWMLGWRYVEGAEEDPGDGFSAALLVALPLLLLLRSGMSAEVPLRHLLTGGLTAMVAIGCAPLAWGGSLYAPYHVPLGVGTISSGTLLDLAIAVTVFASITRALQGEET